MGDVDMPRHPRNSAEEEIKEYHSPSCGFFFSSSQPLHKEITPYQKIEVFENEFFGNILLLDGLVQTTEKDEYFYHEMLTHPVFMSHPHPDNCLIIGGGDGGTLKEVLRYPIQKVWMVEIDRRVIDVCQKFFPWLDGALEDSRSELVVADGKEFVAKTEQKFDVILIDSSEPVGPSKVLFDRKFYEKLRDRLQAGGFIAAQAGSPVFQLEHLKGLALMLRDIFPLVKFYWGPVPTYPGGSWSYVLLSESSSSGQKKRLPPAGLKYYTTAIHEAAFALPGFMKDLSD